MGVLIPLFIIFIACLVIWRACDGFEVASEFLGRNLSEGVRGGTINAVSSSIPELLTTLIALLVLSDQDGYAVGLGTTAGSSLFNGMIIPAACIFFVIGRTIRGRRVDSIQVSVKVLVRDGVVLILAELLLIVILRGSELLWWHGLVMMLLYAVYLTYMLRSMRITEPDARKSGLPGQEGRASGSGLFYWLSLGPVLDLNRHLIKARHREQMARGSWNAWPLLAVSTGVIAVACSALVKACEWLGTGSEVHPSYEFLGMELVGLGMPPLFVAVIFASMATSVPDTIISIRDARDGDYDDAVANAVGSNIFDICFALGFPLFLYTLLAGPMVMQPETVALSTELLVALIVLTVVAVGIYLAGPWTAKGAAPRTVKMGMNKAWLLLSLYAVFMVYVIGRSMDTGWARWISTCLGDVAARLPTLG